MHGVIERSAGVFADHGAFHVGVPHSADKHEKSVILGKKLLILWEM